MTPDENTNEDSIESGSSRAAGAATGLRGRPRTIPRAEEPREPVRTRTRQRSALVDKYGVDPSKIPTGMSYEWKRVSTFGQEDRSYQQAISENGWDPVDSSRHPEFMPPGYSGAIVRDGLMLMERPIELTKEAREEDLQIAREQVMVKEQQLGSTPQGTFTRDHEAIQPRVRKGYEAMPIPSDA